MHIGIDGYEANTKNRVGIGTFAYEIMQNLHNVDKENHYSIFLPSKPEPDMPKASQYWQYKIIPSKKLWTFTSLPFGIVKERSIDVFFSPTHYIPRFVRVPKVVSIMDLSYIHYPELFLSNDLYKLKNWTEYGVKNSKKIITISEFTKSEIIKYYRVKKENITVAYPSIAERYQKISESKDKINNNSDLINKYKIKNEYILYIGTLQPRKNISRLIGAYYELLKKTTNKKINLVIVGKKGWLYDEMFEKVKSLGLQENVIFLDFIPDEDMSEIYRNAKCFILPSLYEGFGIPVIEAMACGTPTVISNTSSLPEVGGNASMYIDPESRESITNGLIKAISLTQTQRQEYIDNGYKQLKKFSWRKSAQIVLSVLKGIKS